MQGLEAIAAQNGWAMAVTGACIVISGLAVLSFIISQLHRIIKLTEKKKKIPESPGNGLAAPEETSPADQTDMLADMMETARVCLPVSMALGETFKLAELYRVFAAANLPHPHITVRQLRDAGYLVSAGEGLFCWKDI